MKLHIDQEWIDRITESEDDDIGGIMACSPEIMKAAEEYAGREWDGSQEDAERLLRYFWQHPFI